MFHLFEGQTADQVWEDIAATFADKGEAHQQPSRAGDTREILHAAISISSPRQRWVFARQPPINPAFAIAETIWMLTGRNDAGFLNYFNRKLPLYCGSGDSYHGAYGYRLRRHLGVDQLKRAYEALRSNPESRQVALQIWDAASDLPDADGGARSQDIPCNVMSLLKARQGKLEWTQIMRSNDIFRGLPYNIVQWTTLQEVMAGWLDLEVGSYNQISDSLHVYEDSFSFICTPNSSSPAINSDSLSLPFEQSRQTFERLAAEVDGIISEQEPVEALALLPARADLPQAYRNLLCVLCAEAARRRKNMQVAEETMSYCTNPAFCVLFDNWTSRVSVGAKHLPA